MQSAIGYLRVSAQEQGRSGFSAGLNAGVSYRLGAFPWRCRTDLLRDRHFNGRKGTSKVEAPNRLLMVSGPAWISDLARLPQTLDMWRPSARKRGRPARPAALLHISDESTFCEKMVSSPFFAVARSLCGRDRVRPTLCHVEPPPIHISRPSRNGAGGKQGPRALGPHGVMDYTSVRPGGRAYR
jgi:hypothetical protein